MLFVMGKILILLAAGPAFSANYSSALSSVDRELGELQDFNDQALWTSPICEGAADKTLCEASHREIVSRISGMRDTLREDYAASPRAYCRGSGARGCLEEAGDREAGIAAQIRALKAPVQSFESRVAELKRENLDALSASLRANARSSGAQTADVLLRSLPSSSDPSRIRELALRLAGNDYSSTAQLYTVANLEEAKRKVVAISEPSR